jgi:hypothetical protein
MRALSYLSFFVCRGILVTFWLPIVFYVSITRVEEEELSHTLVFNSPVTGLIAKQHFSETKRKLYYSVNIWLYNNTDELLYLKIRNWNKMETFTKWGASQVPLPVTVMVIKRRLKRTGHVACMIIIKNASITWVGKQEGKSYLGKMRK